MTNLTTNQTERNLILNNIDIIESYWMGDADVLAIEITTNLKAFNDIEYAKDEAEFTQVAEFGKKWIISNEDGDVNFIEYDQVTAVKVFFTTTKSRDIIEYVINNKKLVKDIE